MNAEIKLTLLREHRDQAYYQSLDCLMERASSNLPPYPKWGDPDHTFYRHKKRKRTMKA